MITLHFLNVTATEISVDVDIKIDIVALVMAIGWLISHYYPHNKNH